MLEIICGSLMLMDKDHLPQRTKRHEDRPEGYLPVLQEVVLKDEFDSEG